MYDAVASSAIAVALGHEDNASSQNHDFQDRVPTVSRHDLHPRDRLLRLMRQQPYFVEGREEIFTDWFDSLARRMGAIVREVHENASWVEKVAKYVLGQVDEHTRELYSDKVLFSNFFTVEEFLENLIHSDKESSRFLGVISLASDYLYRKVANMFSFGDFFEERVGLALLNLEATGKIEGSIHCERTSIDDRIGFDYIIFLGKRHGNYCYLPLQVKTLYDPSETNYTYQQKLAKLRSETSKKIHLTVEQQQRMEEMIRRLGVQLQGMWEKVDDKSDQRRLKFMRDIPTFGVNSLKIMAIVDNLLDQVDKARQRISLIESQGCINHAAMVSDGVSLPKVLVTPQPYEELQDADKLIYAYKSGLIVKTDEDLDLYLNRVMEFCRRKVKELKYGSRTRRTQSLRRASLA